MTTNSSLGTLIGGLIAIHLVEDVIHHHRHNRKQKKGRKHKDWVSREIGVWD